jgi:hypothetical protein
MTCVEIQTTLADRAPTRVPPISTRSGCTKRPPGSTPLRLAGCAPNHAQESAPAARSALPASPQYASSNPIFRDAAVLHPVVAHFEHNIPADASSPTRRTPPGAPVPQLMSRTASLTSRVSATPAAAGAFATRLRVPSPTGLTVSTAVTTSITRPATTTGYSPAAWTCSLKARPTI